MPDNAPTPLLDYAAPTTDAMARGLVLWLLYIAIASGLGPLGFGLSSLLSWDGQDIWGVWHLDALEWTAGILFSVGGAGTIVFALLGVLGRSRNALLVSISLLLEGVGLLLQGLQGVLVVQNYAQQLAQLTPTPVSAISWMQYVSPLIYWWGFALVPLVLALALSRPLVGRALGQRVG